MLANVVIFSQTAQQTVPVIVFFINILSKAARPRQHGETKADRCGRTAGQSRDDRSCATERTRKAKVTQQKNKRKAGQRPPRLRRRTTDNKPDRDTPIVSQQHRRQAGRHPLPTTPPHHDEAPKAVPRLSSRKGKRISRKAYFK